MNEREFIAKHGKNPLYKFRTAQGTKFKLQGRLESATDESLSKLILAQTKDLVKVSLPKDEYPSKGEGEASDELPRAILAEMVCGDCE